MQKTKLELIEDLNALESRCAVFAAEIARLRDKERERNDAQLALPYRSVVLVVNDAAGRAMARHEFMMNNGDDISIHVDNNGDVKTGTETSLR